LLPSRHADRPPGLLLLVATIDPRLVEPLRLAAIRAFLAILHASDERREDAITFLVIVLGLMRG
jgi:hypothetical protein